MKHTKIKDAVVIDVSPSLDISNAQQFKDWVRREFIEKGEKKIILDFSNVKSIDSYALGVFIALQKSLSPEGGKIIVASPSDSIRRILEITSLDRILTVTDSLDEALEVRLDENSDRE